MNSAEVRRRFLVLVGLRWLSTGLVLPVLVLVMLDRGLSPADVGLVAAMQGALVLLLELPTGGLADAIGRRPVLLTASLFALASYAIFAVAFSPLLFAVAWALQGVYRALESGPLESWFVDAAQADDPDVDIEAALSRSGVVLGLSIAFGSLLSSVLVAIEPIGAIDPLVVPVLVAMAVLAIEMVAIARLVQEQRPAARPTIAASARRVPTVIHQTLRTVHGSRALVALVVVEALWGFGMPAFELLTPVKLDVVSASPERAAELLGPMQVAGWVVSAAGAAAVPWIARRVGQAGAASFLLATQALFVVVLGLTAGAAGVALAFVAVMATHGGANAAHAGLLHRAVSSPEVRSSVVSVGSLSAMLGGTIGGIALGVVADATTLTSAFVVGAIAIALASPLYLVGRDRTEPTPATPDYA